MTKKNTIQILKNSITFWLWFSLTVITIFFVYSWTTLSPTVITPNQDLTAWSWDILSANKWNQLVQRISWIYTNWSWSVWIWTSTPSADLDVVWNTELNWKFELKWINLTPETTRTIDVDNSMTTEEIQAVIDSVWKYIPIDQHVIVRFAAWTYNLTEKLVISDFYWGWNFTIQGKQEAWCDWNSSCTTHSTILDWRGVASSKQWLKIRGTSAAVSVRFFRLNTTNASCIQSNSNNDARYYSLFLDNNWDSWNTLNHTSSWFAQFQGIMIKGWSYGIWLQNIQIAFQYYICHIFLSKVLF